MAIKTQIKNSILTNKSFRRAFQNSESTQEICLNPQRNGVEST